MQEASKAAPYGDSPAELSFVSGFSPVGAGDFAQNAMPFMEIAVQQHIGRMPKGCAGRKVRAVPPAGLKRDRFLELSGTLPLFFRGV